MVLLTEHIRKIETDLATAKVSYAAVKAQGVTEEKEKKANEELEKEKTRSHALADDVDHLKKVLQEKEEAIILSGNLIEDLRVEKTEVARSVKEIEKENTDLVGENTTLQESIRGECLFLTLVFPTHLFLVTNFGASF